MVVSKSNSSGTNGALRRQKFTFLTGSDTEIPVEQIRKCAEHVVAKIVHCGRNILRTQSEATGEWPQVLHALVSDCGK
jgi:hypothetical protein